MNLQLNPIIADFFIGFYLFLLCCVCVIRPHTFHLRRYASGNKSATNYVRFVIDSWFRRSEGMENGTL